MHRVIVPALAELGDEHVRRGQARESKGHTENGICGQQPIERRPLVVLLLLLLVVTTTHAVCVVQIHIAQRTHIDISSNTPAAARKREEDDREEDIR